MRHLVNTLRNFIRIITRFRRNRTNTRTRITSIRTGRFSVNRNGTRALTAQHRTLNITVKRRRRGFFTTMANRCITITRTHHNRANGNLRRLVTNDITICIISAFRIIRVSRHRAISRTAIRHIRLTHNRTRRIPAIRRSNRFVNNSRIFRLTRRPTRHILIHLRHRTPLPRRLTQNLSMTNVGRRPRRRSGRRTRLRRHRHQINRLRLMTLPRHSHTRARGRRWHTARGHSTQRIGRTRRRSRSMRSRRHATHIIRVRSRPNLPARTRRCLRFNRTQINITRIMTTMRGHGRNHLTNSRRHATSRRTNREHHMIANRGHRPRRRWYRNVNTNHRNGAFGWRTLGNIVNRSLARRGGRTREISCSANHIPL